MKILFVRHGESVDDVEDRYGGWADYDLTDKGKKQVADTARIIASWDVKFEIVLSSPLLRAFETGDIIAKELGIKMDVFEYLKERNLNGVLTGLVRSEAVKKYPDQVEAFNNWDYVDGSERAEDFNLRVRNGVDYLKKLKYGSLVAVSHGLFIKTFFREMMGMSIASVGDGGFALIEIDNGEYKLLEMVQIELE